MDTLSKELPLEIWQLIFDKCDFLTQLYLHSCCSFFYFNLRFTDLYNIHTYIKELLSDDILKQKKYHHITKLGAWGNPKIKNVSHIAPTLKFLDANGSNCGIDQNDINGLSLVELHAWGNPKIKNVSHMAPTLKKLDASYNCGIDQNGINGLSLVELCARNNPKITNVSHMATTLKILDASGGNCGIDQNGINGLSLDELNARNNPRIKNVSHIAHTLKNFII
ncbi:putative ORFan [Tupanvirus deep ocean]|uniref:ORFan n=2 Tax=Tupanvirus TaxID=2094720 RepID=A0AC62A9D9_9VIRU|nr:putative ORFan [Tupanvirus deep ocean]QKU34379.1 putative ORFan [Tupanvirus deep ocean]